MECIVIFVIFQKNKNILLLRLQGGTNPDREGAVSVPFIDTSVTGGKFCYCPFSSISKDHVQDIR